MSFYGNFEAEDVEVALASDDRYFDGLLATAGSMAMYADKDICLSFHILDGGISDDHFEYLISRIVSFHQNSKVDRVKVHETDWSRFPEFHGNRMAYARIAAPLLFPRIKQLIYCDVDFLWLGDVGKLWKLRREESILQGVWCKMRTPMAYQQEKQFFQKLGLDIDSVGYINTGLLIMNLEMMRKENFCRKAVCFLDDHPDGSLADQGMYNAVLAGRIGYLPNHWNMATFNVVKSSFRNGGAIHYLGYNPFSQQGLYWIMTDCFVLWHRVNAKIRGISTWSSMRMYSSAIGIVLRRIGFYLNATPIVGSLLRYGLCLAGREGRVRECYDLQCNRCRCRLPTWKSNS